MCKEVTIDPAEHNWHQRIGNCNVSAWLDLQLAQKHSPPLSLSSVIPGDWHNLIRRRPSCLRHCHYTRLCVWSNSCSWYSTCFISILSRALRIFQV